MKKFCADMKKHATEIIICEKKEMLPWTEEEIEPYNNKKFCHICKKKFHDVHDSNVDSDDDSIDDDNDEVVLMVITVIMMLRDLMLLIMITLIMMMIAMIRNLMKEGFMMMLQDLMMLMIMMMRNSMVSDFMVPANITKEPLITAIMQANSGGFPKWVKL